MDNIHQRDAFWNKIYDIAKDNKDVIVISADMGAPALDKFRRDLGGQFVNVGIAEQQAIVLAAGMAMDGKKVFTYAIAPFITLRCYEQIRVNLAGMNLPVTVVGVGAGYSYDEAGPTHHSLEDISTLRILPNMKVHSITDSVMAAGIAEISCKLGHPNYVRLDRKILPTVYSEDADFSSGISVLKEGKKLYIVATGNMVHQALKVSDELKKKHKVDAGVLDVYSIPINEKLFLKTIAGADRIVTMEEQTLPAGLGSAVCEVLADNNKLLPVKRIGLDLSTGYCYKYGGRSNIQTVMGLDKATVIKNILKFLS
jgi:transketolase